jgi:hypothetical protein
MSRIDDKLDETFNISPSDEEESDVVDVKSEIIESVDESSNLEKTEDTLKDYEYTRGNLYSLIEKGQEAINGILELAQETEQARAYEVAGLLIKNVSDATDKLLDLQKKMNDLNQSTKKQNPTTVNNALFVGSTAELSKLLNSKSFKNIQNETLNK